MESERGVCAAVLGRESQSNETDTEEVARFFVLFCFVLFCLF